MSWSFSQDHYFLFLTIIGIFLKNSVQVIHQKICFTIEIQSSIEQMHATEQSTNR